MSQSPVLHYNVPLPIAEAEVALRAALQAQGFGILTEVDVAATLRQKLGVETRPHRLLGACNPRIAHASLQIDPNVGAFLPCGISLREGDSAARTVVVAQNPGMISDSFAAPGLNAPATEALNLIRAALDTIGSEA